jgi:hypothetical protein
LPDKDQYRIHRFPDSGGSLTALPVIETLEGEVSAYIPTNVIFDYRRADLPGTGPVLCGHSPGHQRGHQRVAGGW